MTMMNQGRGQVLQWKYVWCFMLGGFLKFFFGGGGGLVLYHRKRGEGSVIVTLRSTLTLGV